MTLVFDRRAELQGQPGFHVFLVGASVYPHLPGGKSRPAPEGFGLQQLSWGAATAYSVYEWLLARRDHLAVPLTTCRILLSPSLVELEHQPMLALANRVAPAILDEFLENASEWRKDAQTNRDNITLFYFAGHSLRVSHSEDILLLTNFGDGRGGLLRNAVTVDSFVLGMAPSSAGPDIARTQLYFVDASRAVASLLTRLDTQATTRVFDIQLSSLDDRTAPIFCVGVPGRMQSSTPGEPSLFSQVLLRCLNGDAGTLPPSTDLSSEQWVVTVSSLIGALSYQLSQASTTTEFGQSLVIGGGVRDAVIHYLDQPPEIDVTIEIEPEAAATVAHLQIRDDQDALVCDVLPPLTPNPYRTQLSAGFYRITIETEPPNPLYTSYNRVGLMLPPQVYRKVRLLPQ